MKEVYFEIVVMIERLHRLFLEVIKTELEREGILDISNVQALILYNVGTNLLTVGELTQRGYYLGSNVSYNLRKMVKAGYVEQHPSQHDRRAIHIRLSSKGQQLYHALDKIFQHQAIKAKDQVASESRMSDISTVFKKFEVFWGASLSRPL